jgi:adenine-specific DNA glycosylase
VGIVATHGRGQASSVLLTRGEGALFGGLWNLPMTDGQGERAARALSKALGVAPLADTALGVVRHVLSHRAITLELWTAQLRTTPRATRDGSKLVPIAQLGGLGISQLTRKALTLAGL